MGTWELAITKKQDGQLDRIHEFMPSKDNLKAVELFVPLDRDINKAVTATSNLASSSTRSFEIVWDKQKKRLSFWIASGEKDIESYKETFETVYPNLEFSDLDHTVPDWFNKTDNQYQIFDASVRHGHFFAVMDHLRRLDLITHISNAIQRSQNGWIQFVFRLQDVAGLLHGIGWRLDSMNRKVTNMKHASIWDSLTDTKAHKHSEFGKDFARNYKTLRQHSEAKVINQQLIMSIRGLVKTDVELDFNFEVIQNLAFEAVKTTFEHVTKYAYSNTRLFYNNDEKKAQYIQLGKDKTRLQRIDMFPSRLLPEPKKLIRKAVSNYCDTNLIGSYHTRKPLPFLILNASEMPLFVNLPDSTVKHIRLTRGQNIPKAIMDKQGFDMGELL